MSRNILIKVKQFALLGLALPLLLAAGTWNSAQAARPFLNVNITINMAQGGQIMPGSSHTDPRAIQDKTFIELDLKVIVDQVSSKQILKIVDQGIDSEPSGCEPGNFNPLDMEDGLRYFFQVGEISQKNTPQIRATIYPGERSRNPYNDVFCEYDPKQPKKAIFRVRGFFFVRHSRLPDGADIQIRPINPTADEAEKFLKQ